MENQERTEYKFDPKDYGINYKKSWDEITIEESLNMTKNPSDELEKLAEFNANVILFLLGKIEKI